MLFDTKKGTQRKRKDESKKHMHKKNKRSIRKRDDDWRKSSSNFTQVLLLWPHAFPKKDILYFLYFLCALL